MVLYSAGAPGIAILKDSIFNSNVTLGTDIFASDLEPTYTPTTFRIYASFVAVGVLTVRRTSGAATISELLNAGVALATNSAYVFDIIVEAGESVNLQYGATTLCLSLKVTEISMAVA